MKTRMLGRLFLISLLAACAAEPDAETASRSDAELTAEQPDLSSVIESISRSSDGPALDRLFTVDHRVAVGKDRWIHLRETFTPRAWLRWPHRALLMLPGPIVHGELFQIDVEGYRGRDIIAREGAFAFTADFEGTGESSYPLDGRSPSTASQVDAMAQVIRYIRLIRAVPKVDVLGESWGGGVVAELCADAVRVRSCVLASMLYRTPSDFANQTFRSPGFRAMLDSLPDGYITTTPELYAGLTAPTEPAVSAWFLANMPGRYTTGPLYDVFELPFFDPTAARVPGLLIQGELDPNQSVDDALDLVSDWGGNMDLVVISDAGHIPRIEPSPSRDTYWAAILDFLAL